MNVSRIYLLNVSEEVRSELNGVKYESVEYIENLMKCDTISFTVDKYIDIDGTYVDSNYYDQIKESMYVYVSNLNNSNENNDGSTLYKNRGLFRISEVSISNNGHNESKSVTCESSECELGNQSLFGFKINTGELDSAEYLADDNVDEATKLAIEYVTFYNANNSQLSLLDLAIEKVPYWSIGYVDPLLRNKKFSFSIDNKPIYSFLINELSSTAQCVFTFDTINRTINAYSISRVDALGDTNIFVSYRNLLNSTNITRSDMDLVTRFNVSGSDNLSIARVNFDEPYIENLTHLLSDEDKHDNPIYSNSGLRDKYLAWYSYRYGLGGARDTFVQKVKKYNENIVALDELKNKLPVDALDVNQYKDFDKETLQNLLANYMSIINAMVVDFAAYYDDGTMVVDENGFAVIDDQQGLEESIYWEDYQLYKNILIPNIKVAIQNCDLDEEHQLPYNTNYETDWDLYGIVELENKIKVYKQNIDVLKEAGYEKAWSDLTPAEKAKWEQATYNIYHQQYLDYLDLLDDAEDALHDRRVDYQGIENEQDLLLTQIATIKENASIENPNFGFTQNELLTIYKLRRDTDYLNDNILSTSDDDIVSQIDDMNELFEAAMDELDIVSQHQYKLSATLDNLFNLEEFQGYKKDLKAGNFIKMFLREADEMTEVNYGLEDSSPVGLYTSNDDKPMLTHERYSLTPNIVKLRVTSIKRNPCLEDDNSLTLEFSNMIRDKDGLSDYTNLFKSAVNSAFNQINATVKQKLDYTNVAISNSIIKALVSSSALGKRINSLIADTIQAKDGIFDTVQSQYISTDEFEARLARVQSLSASSAFFQFMETNFATIHELDVEVARIDTLVASDANIRNILAGNIGTGSLQTIHLTGQNVVIDDAIITSAMIQGLSASKILAGTIYTSLVKIASDQNESLTIDGATIQISDGTRVRVQIGQDGNNDYSMYIWDELGNLLWQPTGITRKGIGTGTIKDINVANDAAIDGTKLNIRSVAQQLSADGTLTVDSSKVTIDNTTLSAAYTQLVNRVSDTETTTETLETNLSVVQGQITAKVWQSDINDAIDDVEGEISTISDNYSSLTQRVDGIDTEIGSIQTTLTTKADGSTVTALSTRVTSISESLDGVAVRVGTAEQSISSLGTRTDSLETDLEIVQGQITSKVWQTDIEEATDELGDRIDEISTDYSTLEQTVNGISTTVGSISQTVNGHTTTISGMQSSITQNAQNIELKVNKDAIISSINLSSEQASINASKINLHGYTTINNYFQIDTDGKLTARDGDFSGTITATNGKIGNWNIGETSIYSGSAVWKNPNGMYFGERGLSLTDNFYVDENGNMTANQATIRGNIYAEYLELSDGVKISTSSIDGLTALLEQTAEGIQSIVKGEIDKINKKPMMSRPLCDSNGYKIYDSNGNLLYGTQSFEEIDMADTTDKMWSSIIQNADNIELKVNKNGVIAAINLSSEQASINAAKISLEGLTTINNYFKILTDGKMECIGGTIAGWTIDNNAIWRTNSSFNGNNGMYFGVDGLSIGHDKFNVTSGGILNATGVNISGSITATSLTATNSGTIANWNINSSCLYYNNSTFKNANGIYLGTSGISVGDVFYVDKTNGTAYFKGSVNATSLTLSAGAIDYNSNIISNKPNLSQYLTQSDLNGYVTTQDLGDYVKVDITRSGSEYSSTDGTKTRSFKVSKKGLLEAENAIIRGTIYAGAGEIGALSINQDGLTASQDYYDEYYRSCNITTEIQPGSISIRHYDEYHRMYPYIFTISGERVYMHDIECISINPTEEIGYVDCSDIRMTNALHMGSGDYDVQAISYNTSGYMYFGANSSYTTTSVLRGTSVNIYSHSNGVTIGSSGDRVYLVGSVYENGTLLSSKYGKAVSVSSSSSSVSLTKETYNSGSFSVSKNGYTPLGIVGYEISGSRSNYMNLYRHYISGTTYYWSIRNNSSDTVSDTLTVYVLYSKN